MTPTREATEPGAAPEVVAGVMAGAVAGDVVVLTARQVRRRAPSAVVWRLLTYDPATRTPVADIARRWQPAGIPPAGTTIPMPVTAWIATVLGPGTTLGAPADDFAGPDSWHVHPGPPVPGRAANPEQLPEEVMQA